VIRTADTATLFYAGDRTELKMYDCTSEYYVRGTSDGVGAAADRISCLEDLVADSYVTLAALCPNLEQLTLELCGQLTTDTMIKWGQVFPNLKRLELWGPFNVRKEGWIRFFKDKGEQLEGLLIT
jgi:DNA repair protein RAD7